MSMYYLCIHPDIIHYRAEGRNDRESREQYPPSSGSSSWDTRRKEIDSGHLRDERVVDSDRVQYRLRLLSYYYCNLYL